MTYWLFIIFLSYCVCHLTVGCIGFYTSYTVNLHLFDLVSLRWAVIKSVISCDLASFWNFLNSNHRACINTSLLLVIIVSVRDCLGEHLDGLVSSFTSARWKTLIQTSLPLPTKQSTKKKKNWDRTRAPLALGSFNRIPQLGSYPYCPVLSYSADSISLLLFILCQPSSRSLLVGSDHCRFTLWFYRICIYLNSSTSRPFIRIYYCNYSNLKLNLLRNV